MRVNAIESPIDRENVLTYLEKRLVNDQDAVVLLRHAPALLLKPERDMVRLLHYIIKPAAEFALFAIGMNSSLSVADLLQLRFKDIFNAVEGRIVVGKAVVEVKTTVLRAVMKLHDLSCYEASFETPIFGSLMQCEIDGKTVQKPFEMNDIAVMACVRDICRKCSIEGHFGSSTLRKTYAVSLLQKGMSLDEVRYIMDQRSLKALKAYLGIS